VRFELDDEHYEFADVVDRTLDDAGSVRLARRCYDGLPADAGPLLDRLGAIGVTGITVPPEHGGAGLSLTDALLVVEALGGRLAPDFLALTIAAAPVIARHAPSLVADDLLTGMASGERRLSLQDGWDGWAPWAATADVVLVADDDRIVVTGPRPGSVAELAGVDPARQIGRVPPSAPRLAVLGPPAATDLRRRATTVTAVALGGVAARMVRLAADYAARRTQFGVPIGSFQGVKHLLADAYVAVEGCRRVGWWASYCIDGEDRETETAVATAKALAGEAATAASYAALQTHGGVGYMWDTDLHLWMKRALALAGAWGDTAAQWRALAKLGRPASATPAR
jgi:alkylation response protein AidB-like acyl-CoA dehydrogenase